MDSPGNLRTSGNYRHNLFYIILLLVIASLSYWPLTFHIFSLKNDALNYFLPVRRLVSEAYFNGILPLWTPYLNLGYPLHGDMQSGVWNPVVQIISLFGPYNLHTLQLETVFYIFLSGAGMFYLLKHFRVSPLANMMISVAYMLCGFNTDSCQFLNWIATASFLPFVFLFYHRCLDENSFGQAVKTGMAVFFLFSCAYPADFIIASYLMMAMFLWHIWKLFKTKGLSVWKPMMINHIVILGIFLLLASPAVLSYYESLPLTERGAGASYEAAMSNPLHPALLGAYTTPLAIWKMPGVNVTDPLLRNSYFGIITFFLAIVGFLVRGNRLFSFCKIAVVVFLVFSFGEWAGLRTVVYYFFPFGDTFRHPANAKIFTIFFSCLLAAFAFQKILFKEIESKKLKIAFGITTSILLLVLAWSIFTPFVLLNPSSIWQNADGRTGGLAMHFKEHLKNASFADIVVLTTFLQVPFLYMLYRFVMGKLAAYRMTTFAIMNCMIFTMLFLPFTVVKKQSAASIQAIIDSVSVKGYPLPDNVKSVADNSIDNEKFWVEIGCQNLYNKKVGRSDYRITPSNLISQNQFWFNDSVRETMMKRTLLHKEMSDTSNGVAHSTASQKQIAFKRFRPDLIEIAFDLDKAGEFVLMQNYYPRWQLYIDDKPAQVKQVHTTFMGFNVPPGKHTASFRYETGIIGITFVISSLLLGCFALFYIVKPFVYTRRPSGGKMSA